MAEKLKCDLVMRGGITSGIVYPRAIAELAKNYDFCSIGGTSAGAIAAAGTAAAALGRRNGVEPDPFESRIKDLPRELGTKYRGKTQRERLFQPEHGTRRLFSVLMAGLGRESLFLKVPRILFALWRNYWPLTLLGALIGLGPVIAFVATSGLSGFWFYLLLALGLLAAAVVVTVAASGGVVSDVLKRLPENGYGMCSGSDGPGAYSESNENGPPLTDWLHTLFQDLAGAGRDAAPVTFGDLWGNGGNPEAKRDIELVLMSTNITRGISQRFPFLEGSWGRLLFKKEEFAELFPPSVVKHICEKGELRKRTASDEDWADYESEVETRGFVPLPAPADLPILLGARLSLSFPFLLSAVPLYAANGLAKPTRGKIPLERCWFSDGGLTSNFPLHFFDSPLPRHPTFGINLMPASVRLADTGGASDKIPDSSAASDDPWSYIYMPSTNASGISDAAPFNIFDRKGPSVGGFFSAMFDTARNWADTELMAMPGYRDRIVHVMLRSDEGGLNLNMPDTLIRDVGERGEKAGELLAARFAEEPGLDPQRGGEITLTWDNHRWVRYRSLMAGLELVLKGVRSSWNTGYGTLLDRPMGETPSYQFQNMRQRDFARQSTATVLAVAKDWETVPSFDRYDGKTDGRSPRPKPTLRMMPLGSGDPRAERPDGSETPRGTNKGTV